ncbi:MAG: Hsp20/alpha crystallin family protein, partial [Lachnospiraceae bacterium]|nr:Hsp20/alpha crystallin family protein [Lachnospiraceae bacterium]
DIKEKDKEYELHIDLPGFDKEEIQVSLDNGYLTIQASKGLDKDEDENDGKWIHKERYAGSCMRQFYVGDGLTQEDVKAEFKKGILKLTVPKKEALPDRTQNKYIAIEG